MRLRPAFQMTFTASMAVSHVLAQSTAFTYQGQLKDNNVPGNANYDFQFAVYSAATGGTQVGSIITVGDEPVSNGLFTVSLDFGLAPFNGTNLWLEVRVRPGASTGAYTTLTPRQPITAAPLSLYSLGPWAANGTNLSYLSGNVGIGTSSPSNRLTVTQNADSTSILAIDSGVTASQYSTLRLNDRGASYWAVTKNPSDDFSIREVGPGLDRLYVAQGGNVGIGTSTPTNLLTVAQNSNANANIAITSGLSAAEVSSLHLDDRNTTYWSVRKNSVNDFSIREFGPGLDRLYIAQGGNVGLNNPAPNWPLSFANTMGDKISLYDNGTTHSGFGIQPNLLQIFSDISSADIALGYGESAAFTENLRITGSGRVGIGTSAPQAKLDVLGGAVRVSSNASGSFGDGRVVAYINGDEGVIETFNSNGDETTYVGAYYTGGAGGIFGVADLASPGYLGAGGYYNSNTNSSVLFAGVKQFREPNPRQPDTDIAYACIEGPEAAAYVRGTATLVSGSASISLPEHFQDVAIAAGMTIQLTPCSADSNGLAVVAKAIDHFEVKELQNGAGNYSFDWRVEAIRRGQENYQVIRPSSERRIPTAADRKATKGGPAAVSTNPNPGANQ